MSTTVKLKRGSGSDPSASDMVVGEPVIRTDTAELFFKKDDGSVAKVSGGGGGPDFKYLDLRNAANNGSASYPGNDFTLVTSGTTTAISPAAANTLLVSYGGVIQKPNSGTSTSGITGFIVDGSRFKTATNLAAAPDFILYQESGGIGEPSDDTVTNAKVTSNAAIAGTKISPDFGSQNITTSGEIEITGSSTVLKFTENDANPDFGFLGSAGSLRIQDLTNTANLFIFEQNRVRSITNFDAEAGLDVTGNITVTGTVDGVDIAALNTTVGTKAVLTGSTNNTIATVSGANALVGEANLTFDGSVLNVVGNVDINNGTGQAHYEISQTNGNTVKFGIVSGSDIELSGSANNSMYFKTNNTERFRIAGDGKIYVGGTTASHTIGEMWFNDTSAYSSVIKQVGGSSALTFHTGQSQPERLRIDSNGDVGIGGVTDPLTPLHVGVQGSGSPNWGGGNAETSVLRIEDKGSNDGYYHGLEIRSKRSGDTRLLNLDRGSNTSDFIIMTDNAGTIRETFRVEAEGDCSLADGNLKFSAGHGIDFSASPSASGMSSETLADYEHGTWDPGPTTSNPSWNNKDGTYVRIGTLVHCDMWLRSAGTSSSTSQIICSLPFAASTQANARPTTAVGRVYNLRNWGSNGNAFGWVSSGSSNLNWMWNNNGSNPGEINMNVWQSGAEIHASITYRTNN